MTPEQHKQGGRLMSDIKWHECALNFWEGAEKPGDAFASDYAISATPQAWKTFRSACIDHSHRELERLKKELAAL